MGVVDKVLSRRNRFPGFVNRVIDSIAENPTSMVGRLAARRWGAPSKDDATPVSTVREDARVRVLIAPVNYSGQAFLWARALESAQPDLAAATMAIEVTGGFAFPTDLEVSTPVYHNGKRWQRAQRDAATSFTHTLIEAEEPLFGRLFDRDVARESRYLIENGVNVAFMAHGTDIRLPSGHRERTIWSPYRDPDLYLDRLERLASLNQRILEDSGRPLFVSTPDLLADLPSARWCPVVVDPAAWATPEQRRDGPLRVVHAPTSALMKGTHLIEAMLHSLHEKGVIDYRPVRGVPAAEMPTLLAHSDVVLDQFRLGSYGVAACEAMAAGRLVIGHVMTEVRDAVESATKITLPIVEATPDSLESVLEAVAQDPTMFASAQRAGPEFVTAVHDGRLSSQVLIDNWIARSSATARRGY